MTKIKYLIVDTSAFIKNASLQNFGENIITIQEVVNEITNKRQIRRLVVLPYDLIIKDVFPENIKFVSDFSKKTGDYPSLSATDIKVLALTFQLEKEKVGTDHLNENPQINKILSLTSRPKDIPHVDVAGFYLPKKMKNKLESKNNEENKNNSEDLENQDEPLDEKVSEESQRDKGENENMDFIKEEKDNGPTAEEIEHLAEKLNDLECDEVEKNIDQILAPVNNKDDVDEQEYDEGEESEDGNEDVDDDEGWVTPKNICNIKKDFDFKNEDDKPIEVACITSDFAMQNVLKQLGLNVISEDGTMIKNLRTFILRCYACFKTTSIMTKVFCPYCGNKTLKKVAYSLKEDGTQEIHINPRKRINTRGKRFSMPTPQGGKHAVNPHLYEDQRFPQQMLSKMARQKNDPLDPDYIAGYSPFTMRDTNSKSAMLGLHCHEVKYWMRRNPNEAIKKGKKKK